MRSRRRVGAAVLALTTAIAGVALSVGAPVTFADSLVVTSAAATGPGSLLAAVDASRASGGPDTITFDLPEGVAAITLDDSLPAFADAVTLIGPGADELEIVGPRRRIFWTQHDFSISGVTLRNGSAIDGAAIYSKDADLVVDDVHFVANESSRSGAAIYVRGGTATIDRSEFRGNLTRRNGSAIFAGPVDAATDLTITNTLFDDNRLLTDRAGTAVDHRAGLLTIDSSTFRGNIGFAGSGVTATDTTVITRSEFIENHSETGGAAITNYGDLTLDEVTVRANKGFGSGGNQQVVHTGGELTITRSTFDDADAGGTLLRAGQTFQQIRISNSTFAGGPVEFAETLGGPVSVRHSTFVDAPIDIATTTTAPNFEEPTVFMTHSIMAQLDDTDERLASGQFDTVEHTLIEDDASVGATTTTDNIVDLDAFLAPLDNNGGLTDTFLPSADSPAINAGIAVFGEAPPTDQRGTERIQNNIIDLGAVENGTYGPDDFIVRSTETGGPSTLRSAIFAAEATPGADMITFDLEQGDGRIDLETSLPEIHEELSIVGPGQSLLEITIDRQRFFYSDASLSVSGATLTGGGGDIGGAIWADGADLVVDDVAFRSNSSTNAGAAIYADGDQLSITNSLFDLNSTFDRGAAVFAGPSGRPTVVDIAATRFTRNTTADLRPGAAIEVESGALSITNSVITDNRGDSAAGVLTAAPTTIINSQITRNISQRGGTAIASSNDLALSGVLVSDNDTAGDSQGGQVVHRDGMLIIEASTFDGSMTVADPDPSLSVTTASDDLAVSIVNSTFSEALIALGPRTTTTAAHSTFVATDIQLAVSQSGTPQATLSLDHSIVTGPGWTSAGIDRVNRSLIETSEGWSARLDAPGTANLIDVDPRLLRLADNGGPTPTFLPERESAAIGAGDPAITDPPTFDQRGAQRVQEGAIDIGAVETSSAAFDPPIFTPITPSRLVDTRLNGTTVDGRERALGPITRHVATMAGRDGIPVGATGVMVNVTAINPPANGWLAIVPCDGDTPTTASLNYAANTTASNEVAAPLSSDGTVCVDSTEAVQVVLDVVGYTSSGSSIDLTAPTRLDDTRIDATRLSPGGRLRVPARQRDLIPDDAAAAIVNVTAVNPTDVGFLTVHPCQPVAPVTASVNYVPGVNRGNEIVAAFDETGAFCVDASSAIDVTVDLVGWVTADARYARVGPQRILDTRMSTRLTAGQTVVVPVDADAELATVNITAVRPSADGFITIRNCDETASLSASLTYTEGVTAGNEVITSIGSAGNICIFTSQSTHLTVDLAGLG